MALNTNGLNQNLSFSLSVCQKKILANPPKGRGLPFRVGGPSSWVGLSRLALPSLGLAFRVGVGQAPTTKKMMGRPDPTQREEGQARPDHRAGRFLKGRMEKQCNLFDGQPFWLKPFLARNTCCSRASGGCAFGSLLRRCFMPRKHGTMFQWSGCRLFADGAPRRNNGRWLRVTA